MIYITFQDLSSERQEELFKVSREDVEHKFGESIRKHIDEKYVDEDNQMYERLIEEEMIKNLYTYNFVFNI
tara:strand:+ start:274 stop:486 length:213 start_codon:yes stop_codon:yes gene_type:complete